VPLRAETLGVKRRKPAFRHATPPPQQRFLFQIESEAQTDVRYTPETIAELRNLLYGCPNLMKVEVKDEIPLNTKTVADLRTLMHWSSDWTLAIPLGRDPWHAVRVERRTATSSGGAARLP
jgi:hypothetical protein